MVERPIEEFVRLQNIRHLQAALRNETDPDRRRLITELIREHQANGFSTVRGERAAKRPLDLGC